LLNGWVAKVEYIVGFYFEADEESGFDEDALEIVFVQTAQNVTAFEETSERVGCGIEVAESVGKVTQLAAQPVRRIETSAVLDGAAHGID